jgi:uncharacterized membrane protein YtjA (UPF0391 family)
MPNSEYLPNELQTLRIGQIHFGGAHMLYWAVVFFIISIVAALFGFTGISAAAAGIAKIFFFIFLVVFLVFLIAGIMRRPPRAP